MRDAELGGSAAALKKLGGAYGDTRAFTLPDGSERRWWFAKRFRNADSLPPQRRKNCKKASLI